MKGWKTKVFGLFWVLVVLAGNGFAADLEAVDRVSVNMNRTEVRDLLGPPDMVSTLSIGLDADMYELKGLMPLIGKGCVYSEEDRLVGQAFVLAGSVADATVTGLKKNGFTPIEEKPGAILLIGKDDDTAQPILVSVSENGGFTTVVTFEKDFYEKYGEKKENR